MENPSPLQTPKAPSSREMGGPAALLTAFLCIALGANAVALKYTVTSLGVFTSAALRFAIASAAIACWAAATGGKFRLERKQTRQVLILSGLFLVQVTLFYFGLDRSNASRATLVTNLLPFFVLLMAHFFIPGEPLKLHKTVGIALGFAGVVFVFLEEAGTGSSFPTGDLLILAAMVIWAGNVIYTKKIIDGFEPFQLAIYPMMAYGVWAAVASLTLEGETITRVDETTVLALGFQALVTGAFGFIAWNTLLKRYGAVSMHSYLFLAPISGVALGGLLLDEPVATTKLLVALVLIVVGIVVVNWRFGPRKRRERG